MVRIRAKARAAMAELFTEKLIESIQRVQDASYQIRKQDLGIPSCGFGSHNRWTEASNSVHIFTIRN